MDGDEEWDKAKYKNWVRGAKGLEYLQEGLQNFVGVNVQSHRDQTVKNIVLSGSSVQCNQCTLQNLLPEHAGLSPCTGSTNTCIQHSSGSCLGNKPRGRRQCPNGICSKLYDEIVRAHRFKDPMWRNTDPGTWCSDLAGWSFAKCFQTTPNPGTSSSETDAAGLLSVILSDKLFQNEVSCKLAAKSNIFSSAREIRNDILHSPKMELEDSILQGYIDVFIIVLQDPRVLLNDHGAVEAVQKLVQLKNDEITISLSEQVKLIQIKKDALTALEQLEEKEKKVVAEIEEREQDTLAKIEGATSEALEKLNESDIRKRVQDAEDKIEQLTHTIQNLKRSAASAGREPLTPTDVKVQKTPGRVDRFFNRFKNALGFGLQRDLQNDLIKFYRRHHTNIPLSPLIEEDTPLLEFYVMPDIKSVKRAWGGGEEEKTLVSPFRSVFYKENKMCNEIYLTADAGLGKTAFSKRLALTWCHAKKPLRKEKRFFSSHEEIQVMNEFCFVFLVLLCDSFSKCDIDDLIFDQIISRLASTYTFKDIENILRNEKCLVILEGLDEWSHPSNSCEQRLSSIPHRTKMSTSLTVLTTTRPWKLSVSGLHSSQIDKHLEIIGLNQIMANKLKKSVISHMYSEKNDRTLNQHAEKFTIAMKEKRISDLEAVPLLLMYLLFLWKCNIDLGHSQSELYSGIIELLFSRTAPRFKDMPLTAEHAQGEIPHCLINRMHCRQFYTLMTALGQLAFRTLFNETKEENMLVFDSSTALQYLSKECLTFCLGTGIITQSNVQGELLEKKSKVSYAHKTVQEYFAALYMSSTPSQTSVPEIVLSKCKCLKDILDMSKVLIFISGINVNVLSLNSRELMRIINDDEITDIYRSTLTRSIFKNAMKEFQDMCILCCNEFPHENVDIFCLQDVFIGDSCRQKQYREHLKQLTTRNKHNIKSLYIHMRDLRGTTYNSAQKVIEYFELRDLENIEKIHYDGDYNDDDILPLLNSSVKCLYLSRCYSSWSRLLFEKVTSLQKLEVMNIDRFSMSHSELTFLFNYMPQRHCMREIGLERLCCTDHRRSCTACLDLSQHSQLRKLTLEFIPMSELKINMASLEECCLRGLDNPELVLRFVNCVTADNKLNTFICRDLESSAATETMLDTLRLSVHVKHVELWYINLGNRELPLFSEMVNIERVKLGRVTMPASVFRDLVDAVQKLPHTVIVNIYGCDITPEREFKTEKNKIKSPHFRVLNDRRGRWGSFVFVTCNN